MKRYVSHKSKSTLEELWETQLNIAIQFKNICEKYNLSYFLMGSALVGAVRTGRFLPWKDGITFAMPREDYKKFIKYAKVEYPDNYEIQPPEMITDAYNGGYTFIRDNNTTCINAKDIHSVFSQGVWIKVAPIDFVSENEFIRKWQERMIRFNQMLIYANVYGYNENLNMVIKGNKRFIVTYSKIINVAFTLQKLNKWLTMCKKSNIISTYIFRNNITEYKHFDISILDETIETQLNGVTFKTFKRYEELLIAYHGSDYLRLPEKSRRIPKSNNYYIDVTTPYKESLKLILRDKSLIEEDIPDYNEIINKTVIVFGDEKTTYRFIRSEHEMFRPKFIVTDDKKEVGKKYTVYDYEVYDINKVLEVPEEDRIIIICSPNFIEKAKTLMRLGINNCHIYCSKGFGLETSKYNCGITYCMNGNPVIYNK